MKRGLHVELLAHTPNPEQLIAASAKLCYSASEINDLVAKQTPERARNFIDKLMGMGHQSPLEHVSYNFGVEGISRVTSHQLVRHRIASYSQQSQRYVGEQSKGNENSEGCFDFIVPPSIKKAGLEERFVEMMKVQQGFYDELSSGLSALGLEGEKVNEDARYILPNAAETKLIATMNARELLHFFEVRACNRAQWEIRDLAKKMYELVFPTAPTLFKYAGPKCVISSCSEGKMSCGSAKEVVEEFKKLRGEK